ncbi:TPA: hypothetical protein MIP33_14410 [Klebsiella pneumoniae]|nr:hypothetical protein [Klebsiella pneumoniae]HBY4283803.1 hypothetical protein [Klebsiella pneumoniae]
MTEFSQLAFFYHHQLLPAGFTAKSCTTRLFCTSYHLIKIVINQKIKTQTKNKPLRCTYSNEKSCT